MEGGSNGSNGIPFACQMQKAAVLDPAGYEINPGVPVMPGYAFDSGKGALWMPNCSAPGQVFGGNIIATIWR